MISKHIIFSAIFLSLALSGVSQHDSNRVINKEAELIEDDYNALFDLLKEKDSLLFQVGFNQIDSGLVSSMTAEDFEFYHDVHGITESKAQFVKNIQGIEDLPFTTWRKLIEESMQVFPLKKNNSLELYGAIQSGVHDFYQQHEGELPRKTNTAKFTHLWIIENNSWKLKRVLSYDHSVPNEAPSKSK